MLVQQLRKCVTLPACTRVTAALGHEACLLLRTLTLTVVASSSGINCGFAISFSSRLGCHGSRTRFPDLKSGGLKFDGREILGYCF